MSAQVAAIVGGEVRRRLSVPTRSARSTRASTSAPPVDPAHDASSSHWALHAQRIIGGVGVKLLLSDTADVPALLDVMLCEDVLAEFARPLAGVLEDVALTDLAAAHDRLATQLDALPSEAAGAVRSALLVQGELLRLIHTLVENKSIRTPSADELAMDHGGVRRWFLTEAPLEVAQRFVAWERGALATVGVAAALEPTASLYDYAPLTLRLLAETARDGAKAMLAILASARPELVPLELVGAEDRFDITAAEQREAEHLESLARIAAQVGDDEIRWLNPRD